MSSHSSRLYYSSSWYTPYCTVPPKAIQELSEDAKKQVDGLSSTLRKFEGLHKSLVDESKLTWFNLCTSCQRKVSNIELPSKKETECQTEKDVNVKLYPKVLQLDCLKAALGLSADDEIDGLQTPGVDQCFIFALGLKNKSEGHDAGGILHTEELFLVYPRHNVWKEDDLQDTKAELQRPKSNVDAMGKEQGAEEKTLQDLEIVTENLKRIYPKRPPEIQKLEENIAAKDREIRQLTATNETLKKEVGTLNTERRILRKDNETLTNKQKELDGTSEGRIYFLEHDVDEKKKEIQKLQHELEEIKVTSRTKIDQLTEDLQTLQQNQTKERSTVEGENFNVSLELDRSRNSHRRNDELSLTGMGKQQSILDPEILGATVETTQNIYAEKMDSLNEIKQVSSKLDSVQQILRRIEEHGLTKKQDTITEEKLTMQVERDRNISDIEDENRTQKKVDNLEKALRLTKDKLDNFISEKAKLTSDLKSLQQEKLSMQQELEGKMAKLKEINAESETENLRKSLDELNSLKTERNNMTRDMKTFTETIEELRKSLSALEGEKAKIQTDLEQQLADFRKHNNTLSSTNSVLQRQISSKDDEVLSLKNNKDRLKEKMRTLKEERQTSQKNMTDPGNLHEKLKSESRELQSTIDAYEAELNSLKTDQNHITRDVKTAKENNEQLVMRLSAAEGEKAKMQTDHEQQMTDIRHTNSTLSSTNSVLQQQISLKDDEVISLKSDNDRLKGKMRTLKEERKTSQKNMTDLENLRVKLVSESRELQSTIGTKDNFIQSLETQSKDLAKDLKNLEREKEQLKTEIRNHGEDNDRLTKNVRLLEEKKAELTKKVTTLEIEKGNMTRNIDDHNRLTTNLTGLKAEKEQLTTELRKQKEKNEQLSKNVKTLEDEKHQLTNGETVLQKEKENMKRNITTLETEKEQLTMDLRKHEETTELLSKNVKTLEKDKKEFTDRVVALEREKESMARNIRTLETEQEQLTTDLRKHEETKELLSKNVKTLEKDKKQLTDKVVALEREKESMARNIRTLETEQEQLTTDLRKHEETKELLSKKLKTLEEEKEELINGVTALKREKENVTRNITTLEAEMEQLTKDLKEYEENKELLSRNVNTLEKDKKQLTNRVMALEREKGSMARNITTLETEKTRLTMDFGTLAGEKESLAKNLGTLKEEKISMETNYELKLTEFRDLQHEIRLKEEENHQIKMEILELKTPKQKSIVLGVRYGSSIGRKMVDMVTRELTKGLEQMMDMTKFDLTIKLYHKASETPKGPMVVLCLNMSRVGTNMQDALAGIEVNSDVSVLVLHHTNKDNLSSLTPTSLRVGKEFRKLGAILDMAFSSDDGLYDCDLNTTAIDKLATILKKC